MDFGVVLFQADIQTHKKWNHGSHLHIDKIFIPFLPMYTSQLTEHRAMGTQQNRRGCPEYQETLLSLGRWWSTDTGCPEAMECPPWRPPKAAGMWCRELCSIQVALLRHGLDQTDPDVPSNQSLILGVSDLHLPMTARTKFQAPHRKPSAWECCSQAKMGLGAFEFHSLQPSLRPKKSMHGWSFHTEKKKIQQTNEVCPNTSKKNISTCSLEL